MPQDSPTAPDSQQVLSQTLYALSLREQITILLAASRTLSGRERALLLRNAGLSLFKDRFLPFVLHLLLTRLLAGAIWGFLCGIAAFIVLVLLALVDHVNAWADWPVIVALVSLLVGSICFALCNFCREFFHLFKRTRSRAELQQLQITLQHLDDAARIALLGNLAGSISHSLPGESLPATLLSGLLFIGVALLLTALLVILAFPFHQLAQWPYLGVLGLLTFILGLQVPRVIYRFLNARGIN